MTFLKSLALVALMGLGAQAAGAATLDTNLSPTSKGVVPTGVSTVGGIVFDLVGLNGVRVVSQLSAASLYLGYATVDPNYSAYSANPAVDPLTIGTQTGFTSAVLAALGGGLAELAVRVTLFDGDTSSGDFDAHQNTLAVNGTTIGDFSDVTTAETDSNGVGTGLVTTGFSDSRLMTGWFYTTDAGKLASIFASLSGGSAAVSLHDTDAGDNYFDFKRGIASSMTSVGSAPTVTSPVPVPAAGWMLMAGLAGLGAVARRRTR